MDQTEEINSQSVDTKARSEINTFPTFDDTNMSSDTSLRPRQSVLSDSFHEDASQVNHPGQPSSSSDMVLGQISFAPATQTTVVTTTTTTTTNFPPLMMRAPKRLHELDPKLYPLAASPTPASIKRFCFDVGGKPTVFREAENASDTLHQLQRQHQELQNSGGILRSVTSYRSGLDVQRKHSTSADPRNQRQEYGPQTRSYEGKATASPSSVSDKMRVDGRRTSISQKAQGTNHKDTPRNSRDASQHNRSSSRLQIVQTSTPITPSVHSRTGNSSSHQTSGNTWSLPQSENQRLNITPEMETSAFLSPRPDSNYAENSFQSDESFSTVGGLNTFGTPEARTQIELDSPTHRGESSSSSVRPRPSILDTTAAQDGSLPSPSLSPVTAAAHLQSRKGYFDDLQINTNPPHEYGREMSLWKDEAEALASRSSLNQGLDFRNQGPSSMMEIPGMLDAFETMPSEMKSYFMYQLLRRCPKPVLHFVADSVNPALKCDFLNLLPLELCQNVIGHLDLKSLCRAAQVSKKWQRIIDTDEKTWKNLFDAEGYDLSPGELKRAIAEGWGWQHGSDLGGFEKDLSNLNPENNTGKRSSPSGDSSELSHCASPTPEAGPQSSRRSKRKAATKSRAVSRKTQKKKDIPSNEDALFDNESLKKHIANTEGPYAAAQAALAAIPNSNIGLPSLRSLRLYKSIYRRHHLISKNWMQDVIKPRHLAFKAHQRHVVTCLQFDSDKILTGSDDTNINVYDTRTGAKRETLQGHEGGVWALQYEGNTLVSGSTDRSVRVWDIEKGKCTHVFQGHTSTVRCLVILMPAVVGKRSDGVSIMMPEEPLIITGSRDSTLRIWKLPKPGDTPLSPNGPAQDDADSPYFVRVFTGHIHSVRAIAAYGDTLVSGSYDCTVRVWKISTGETLHRLQGHAQKVYSVVLDHERNRCISGSMDNMVKVWSLDTGTVLHNLEGHSSLVGLLDLQRNYLVSAAADSTLRIWDPENGQCKSILSAHTGAITCFQHDGRKVISGSDRNLKMWNIKTGGFVRDLLTDLSGVWQVKFDEQRCVAAVQRSGLTYIEVLDFGASRDGLEESKRGRRILVNGTGREVTEIRDPAIEPETNADD